MLVLNADVYLWRRPPRPTGCAKCAALLFKQQDTYVQKIILSLRGNYKKFVAQLLPKCILQPKTHASGRGSKRRKSALAQPLASLESRQVVTEQLDSLRQVLDAEHVPVFLAHRLFQQLFSFMNVQLFNQLLLRRECCSFSNGEYVKAGLAELEAWTAQAGEEAIGDVWEQLRAVRQAVTFLVVHQKDKKSLGEIRGDLCPSLSIQQLYRISTMYWDDKYNTETVSHQVLAEMKRAMMQSASTASHSFLLDDDTSIPFTLEDIVREVDDKDLYGGIPVPEGLQQPIDGKAPNPDAPPARNFEFLRRDLKTMMAAPPRASVAAG